MVQQILLLGLYIIIAVCFLEVRCQGTPVLTIAQSPITVGDGDQYAELKCQIAKSSGYITRLHRLQRKQADSSYTTIATVSFQRRSDTIVNDAVLGSRSEAVLHDPATTTFFAGSLQIRDVICTDAGRYRCETQLLNINTGLGFSIYSTDVELVTIKNPRLSYSPSDINVGDDVQFACNGNVGRPAVDLSIAVSIGSLTPESVPSSGDDLTAAGDNCTQTRRVTASRIFTRSEAKSGVIVQCSVVGYPSLVHQRSVDVKYPVGDVEITIDGSNSVRREIDEGRRITAQCQSDGNPTAIHKISFIRTGGMETTQEWSDDRVVIEPLKKTDAGIYFCTAWNTLSSGDFNDSSQNIKLTVTEPPPTEPPTEPLTPEARETTTQLQGTTEPPPTESPIELPTEPPTPEARAPTTQLPGTTEAASSVNVGAVAAGVSVPLVVIIVVLIAIICFYRRRLKSLSDRLIERSVAVGNDNAISCVATPAIQVSYVTMSRTVNEESDRNGCYDEIKDTDNLGAYADYDTPAAVNAIMPNKLTNDCIVRSLPDLTLHIGSPPERRPNHYVNDANEYEMASVETGSVQYGNIEFRCYEKLTRVVPSITHSRPENSYDNQMEEKHGNRPAYENVSKGH